MYPADAFRFANGRSLTPGEIFYFRDAWNVVVTPASPPLAGARLYLADPVTGLFRSYDPAYCNGIALTAAFGWRFAVDGMPTLRRGDEAVGSVLVGSDGPCFLARLDPGSDWLTFAADGAELPEDPEQPLGYAQWTAQLIRAGRPDDPLTDLFSGLRPGL